MGPGRDRTRTPGSAVRQASVARHVTDCATRPGLHCLPKILFTGIQNEKGWVHCVYNILKSLYHFFKNGVNSDQLSLDENCFEKRV